MKLNRLVRLTLATLILPLTLALAEEAAPEAASAPKASSARIIANPDLMDQTYIDRGRMNGVRIGDRFTVYGKNGKSVTDVVVTGVFDRMSSVKIVDSRLLKDGMRVGAPAAAAPAALNVPGRLPAPTDPMSGGSAKPAAPAPAPVPVAQPVTEAAAQPQPPAPAPAPGPEAAPGMPEAPGMPGAPDALPPDPNAMPSAPSAPDALPPAPDSGMTAPPPDSAPPAPDSAPPAPDSAMPPPPDDASAAPPPF